ncbi:MAG: plasmid pRiA4b ORF-3 family protein [Devosia sp.]|nr:plasmid pRiA4b ORF-3 family protein [Devosia sp.]
MSPTRIASASESLNEIATLRIELKDTNPLIWRQVEVPTSITLKVLHDIIQIVIGWFDYHLWEFTIAEQKYGLPMDEDWGTEPRKQAVKVRLRDVLKAKRTIIDYVYDFGDYWEHRIIVTDVRAGNPEIAYPRYIAGERAGPPEDCGGIPGFYDLLKARSDPDDPDHADAIEYLDDYDPDLIEELPIKYALGRIAARRNAAKARINK